MLCMCEVKDQAADMFLGRRVLIMLKIKQIPNLISFCEAEALEAQTRKTWKPTRLWLLKLISPGNR